MDIAIHNSTVTIVNDYNNDVSVARDNLLTFLYYARHKSTMGGYLAWLSLLDMYYCGNYRGMYDHIQSCKGSGGATRNKCLRCLQIIMEDDNDD